jgi:hypothetical protein
MKLNNTSSLNLKSRIIEHPLGIDLKTPLLVPSFSSKGFLFRKGGKSDVAKYIGISKEYFTESTLFSAYDFYYKYIPSPDQIVVTELSFIDSGGYETSQVYDFSDTKNFPYKIKEWNVDKYKEVLSNWPKQYAGICVSFDDGKIHFPLEKQISEAKTLFKKHDMFLNDFLIKPETDKQHYVDINKIIANINELKGFDIIGITEKELGDSILERMKNINKIREALDHTNINSPIHVFGGLDPISCLLYFIAGAEIFDGLTWLRFSYYSGSAIYMHNYGVLKETIGIHMGDTQVITKSIVDNFYYLQRMKHIMIDFIKNKDFNIFNELDSKLSNLIRKAYNTFNNERMG